MMEHEHPINPIVWSVFFSATLFFAGVMTWHHLDTKIDKATNLFTQEAQVAEEAK